MFLTWIKYNFFIIQIPWIVFSLVPISCLNFDANDLLIISPLWVILTLNFAFHYRNFRVLSSSQHTLSTTSSSSSSSSHTKHKPVRFNSSPSPPPSPHLCSSESIQQRRQHLLSLAPSQQLALLQRGDPDDVPFLPLLIQSVPPPDRFLLARQILISDTFLLSPKKQLRLLRQANRLKDSLKTLILDNIGPLRRSGLSKWKCYTLFHESFLRSGWNNKLLILMLESWPDDLIVEYYLQVYPSDVSLLPKLRPVKRTSLLTFFRQLPSPLLHELYPQNAIALISESFLKSNGHNSHASSTTDNQDKDPDEEDDTISMENSDPSNALKELLQPKIYEETEKNRFNRLLDVIGTHLQPDQLDQMLSLAHLHHVRSHHCFLFMVSAPRHDPEIDAVLQHDMLHRDQTDLAFVLRRFQLLLDAGNVTLAQRIISDTMGSQFFSPKMVIFTLEMHFQPHHILDLIRKDRHQSSTTNNCSTATVNTTPFPTFSSSSSSSSSSSTQICNINSTSSTLSSSSSCITDSSQRHALRTSATEYSAREHLEEIQRLLAALGMDSDDCPLNMDQPLTDIRLSELVASTLNDTGQSTGQGLTLCFLLLSKFLTTLPGGCPEFRTVQQLCERVAWSLSFHDSCCASLGDIQPSEANAAAAVLKREAQRVLDLLYSAACHPGVGLILAVGFEGHFTVVELSLEQGQFRVREGNVGAGSAWHASYAMPDDGAVRRQGVGECFSASDAQMIKFLRRLLRCWGRTETEARYLRAFQALVARYDLGRAYHAPQVISNCTVRGQLELFYDIMRERCGDALVHAFQQFIVALFAPCLQTLPDAESLMAQRLKAHRVASPSGTAHRACYFAVPKPSDLEETLHLPEELVRQSFEKVFKLPLGAEWPRWVLVHPDQIVPSFAKQASGENVIAQVYENQQAQIVICRFEQQQSKNSNLNVVEILRRDCYFQMGDSIILEHHDVIMYRNKKHFIFLNSI